MRNLWVGVAALCAAVVAAAPACAEGKPAAAGSLTTSNGPISPDNEVVPVVNPGEEIGIACDALQYTAPDNDVRVVLTIAADPNDKTTPGYKKVLATNEQLTKGTVHVRIPDVPDLANHTVNVNVYIVDASGARNCDAGHMHIANRLQHPKGKQS